MLRSSRTGAIPARFKTISVVLGWRFSGTVLQFVFTVLVARALGAVPSGYVFTWMAWSVFAAALLSVGAPAFVLREASKIGPGGRVALGGLYCEITLAAAIAVSVVAMLAWVARGSAIAPYDHLLLLSVISGYAILLLEVATSALIGIRRERTGIVLRFVGPPLVLCVLLIAVGAFSIIPSVDVIAGTYVITVVGLALAADGLYRQWAGPLQELRSSASRITRGRLWSINVVNALYAGFPFFVLPYFADPRDIAHFAIGYRLTSVAQTATVALGSYFSPRFARAYRHEKVRDLRRLFHSSQLASLALISPLAVFLSPFGPAVLHLFGRDFDGAWVYLAIPVAAKLLIAGCGLTEQFLAMTHNERSEVTASSIAFVVVAIVGLAMGSWYGALGLCVSFYGVSVLKYFATCVATLWVLYRRTSAEEAVVAYPPHDECLPAPAVQAVAPRGARGAA